MIKLMRYLKPYRLQVFIIIGFVLLQAITELFLPNLMARIIDQGVVHGDVNLIVTTGGYMLMVALLGGFATIFSSLTSAKVGTALARDLRGFVFKRVTEYSLHEMDQFGTASLITRSTNDISQVQNMSVLMLRFFTRAPLMAVGSIVMALSKDVPLTFVIISVVIMLGVAIGFVASKAMPMFTKMQEKIDRLNLVLREQLIGIRVIRAFNRTPYEEKRFSNTNRDLTDVTIRVNKLMAVIMPIIMFLFNLSTIALVWFGAIRVDVGAIQVGDMMAFIQYAMHIMMSVMMLVMVFVMMPRAKVSAERIQAVLSVVPELSEPKVPEDHHGLKGHLSFENVTFKYHSEHESEAAALKNISFTSKPGEITAIIGGTGSGKSTLLNLIPRFYDITEGSIKVNGVDIRNMDSKVLRRKIGLVPQQAVIFSGSIKDNIQFGQLGLSDEQLENAAGIAQASEFITQKNDQMDAVISQGGTNLSGGQKQRLSIARALAKHPEIYLFDDCFSALDYKTESLVRQALVKETKEASVLIVAQKVTSVMQADRILVLDEGQLVGIGTHKELLASNQVYQEIVASQLSKEELA